MFWSSSKDADRSPGSETSRNDDARFSLRNGRRVTIARQLSTPLGVTTGSEVLLFWGALARFVGLEGFTLLGWFVRLLGSGLVLGLLGFVRV